MMRLDVLKPGRDAEGCRRKVGKLESLRAIENVGVTEHVRVPEGSHLQTGSMAKASAVTQSIPDHGQIQESPNPQPAKKKKKAVVTGESTHFPESLDEASSDIASDADATPEKDKRAQRASGMLMKQPSIVREDWRGSRKSEIRLLLLLLQKETPELRKC